MRIVTRAAVVVVGVASLALVASPASAAGAAITGLDSAAAGPYRVVSTCTAVVGATTSLNSITYVIEATAVSSSTNGSAPVGTSVRCQIIGSNGVVYGGASGGLPGPTGVGVGTATVPTSVSATARVCGSAVFSDGGAVSSC